MINSSIKKFINQATILYLIGFFLTSIELFLYLFGKTLCQTEGCRIVESFVKHGELFLLISGVVLFGVLFFLSLKTIKTVEYIHSLILMAALSVEGYLVGFQSFIIKEFCLFCILVFSILFFASMLRLIQGKKELIFAFASFISVFLIIYFVNPQIGKPLHSQYVLVYSKDCPNCKEVIQFCKQHSISVQAVDVKEMGIILRALNIDSVPVLFCNEISEKKFIIGADNIKKYFLVMAPLNQEMEGVCPILKSTQCK